MNIQVFDPTVGITPTTSTGTSVALNVVDHPLIIKVQ